LKNTALLVVDVQVEIFSDFERPLYKGDELLRNVKCLIEKAHNTCIPVIYIQTGLQTTRPI
jgi:nicotinamidase-related amidase